MLRYILSLSFLLYWTGCQDQKDGSPVVAKVGDGVLTLKEINGRIPKYLEDSLSVKQKRTLVEQWVEEELLYQEALHRGIHRQREIQELIERSRRDLLIAELLDREIDDQELNISEEMIRGYYERHKGAFLRDKTEIRARHILVEDRKKANRIRRRIQSGEHFEEIAKEESLDSSSALDGGDLGYFSEDMVDPELWSACLNLKIEAISKPMKTPIGYHIIEVLDKKEEGTLRELDRVRSEIIQGIVTEQRRNKLELLVNRLRRKTKPQVRADLSDLLVEGGAVERAEQGSKD